MTDPAREGVSAPLTPSSRLVVASSLSPAERLSPWLRCPRCGEPLEVVDALVLGCVHGHRHDVNRRGWLTTATPRGIDGDSRELLERRAEFLATGAFSPIVDTLLRLAPPDPGRILDSGCGTGHYLGELVRADRASDALALDVSPAAVALAVRATGAAGLVADVWGPLPVRGAVADVVLCVFAPRHPAEFARVLDPNGVVLVVTPTPHHLDELRRRGAVIGMQEGKHAALIDSFAEHLSPVAHERVDATLALSAHDAGLLAGMGPSGHHADRPDAGALDVTLSVDVTAFAHADRAT